jgi:hypothetical protein
LTEVACLPYELHTAAVVSDEANCQFVGLVTPQISRGMLLIIMETESAAGGNDEYIPLRIHDIANGTLLKVCSL